MTAEGQEIVEERERLRDELEELRGTMREIRDLADMKLSKIDSNTPYARKVKIDKMGAMAREALREQ